MNKFLEVFSWLFLSIATILMIISIFTSNAKMLLFTVLALFAFLMVSFGLLVLESIEEREK